MVRPATRSLRVFRAVITSLLSLGIGAACAIALAEAGANICLVVRPSTASTNHATADAIAALGRTVKAVQCDLEDLDAVKQIFSQALEAMGGDIHVLVNCAGIQRRSPAVLFPERDWDDVRVPPLVCPLSVSAFLSSSSSISPSSFSCRIRNGPYGTLPARCVLFRVSARRCTSSSSVRCRPSVYAPFASHTASTSDLAGYLSRPIPTQLPCCIYARPERRTLNSASIGFLARP